MVKSSLRSTAEMCTVLCSVIAAVWRQTDVRTAGPQALSRMRRDDVWGGREGVTREMRWLASSMLQPPVRVL